ncbi:MAG TPA: dihydrofolate reductase family protein, partial [Fibrobacteraceae bacterium]|nr:dihydrofolate reductase family protein [Fibrobacteraceae bacterium]
DDPQLTVRGVPGNTPQRIVMAKSPLPKERVLFQDGMAPTRVYSLDAQPELEGVPHVSLQRWPTADFPSAWFALLKDLGQAGFHRILCECGTTLVGLLLPSNELWNRFLLFTAPKFLGQGLPWTRDLPPNWKDSLRLSRFEAVDCDFLTEFENVYGNHSGLGNPPLAGTSR